MYFVDKTKELLVMERDSRIFKVYDSKTCKLKKSVPDHSKGFKNYDDNGGSIIAAEYVEILGK